MNAKKIDIEKLVRSTPKYSKEFFSEMQKNVFEEIAKLEENANLAVRKKRLKVIKFTGIAASIVMVMGFVLLYLGIDSAKNVGGSEEEFNLYDNFVSNQQVSDYSTVAIYVDEDYDSVLGELSSKELDEEIEKYEMVTYLDYLY